MILDADSIMAGGRVLRLAAAMDAAPDVGLIQTLPMIVNGTTLFARLQQFAGRRLWAADRARHRLVAWRRTAITGATTR